MNFWQWLLGYTDEDIQYLNSINRKKAQVRKDWKKEVDENSSEEYEMCQWYIDHNKKGR